MSKFVIITILVFFLVGAVLVLMRPSKDKKSADQVKVTTSPASTSSQSPPAQPNVKGDATSVGGLAGTPVMVRNEVFILVGDKGVTPVNLTMNKGMKVTWVNTSKLNIHITSDPHPTNTDHPEINTVAGIQPNQKNSVVLSNSGTYNWHNHLSPSVKGTIVVK